MAIKSKFEYKGTKFDSVTFKIIRVFGSKTQGWTGLAAFVPDDLPFEENNYKGLITVGLGFVDANPYPELYGQLESLIRREGFDPVSDQPTGIVDNLVDAVPLPTDMLQLLHDNLNDLYETEKVKEIPVTKTKKPRAKKVK